MRLVCLLLVAVNLCYGLWYWLTVEPNLQLAVAEASGKHAAPLTLLSEAGVAPVKSSKAKAPVLKESVVQKAAPKPVAQAQSVQKNLCFIIGEFASEAQTGTLVNTLKKKGVLGVPGRLNETGGSNYWVYLPSMSNAKERSRVLAKLQSSGVESYLVTKGQYTGSISLGLFENKDTADAVMMRLRRAGYQAKMAAQPRQSSSVWVMVAPNPGSLFDHSTWGRLQSEFPELKLRRHPCKSIVKL